MPNGLTAKIAEGQDVTLRDYLMGVGRMMGYAINQKEDSRDEPLRGVAVDRYHYDWIAQDRAKLELLRSMSSSEIEEAAQRDFEQRFTSWKKRRDERTALRARYEDMIEQVQNWEAPGELASTKAEAVKYLEESLDFDCGGSSYDSEPQPQDCTSWHAKQVAVHEESLESHEKNLEKENVRVAETNRLITLFLNSLPEA